MTPDKFKSPLRLPTLSARDLIAARLPFPVRFSEDLRNYWADDIIEHLAHYGHIIMKKEDVEAIRDKALEEAAAIADDPWASAPCEYATSEQLCKGIAKEIRSLKSEVRG